MARTKQQERKLVLSPTRIGSWLECRLQYKFTYIDKLTRFYYKPNRFDTFGSTLHRTLQMFHEAGGAAKVPMKQLALTYQSCWASVGFESPEQEESEFKRGTEIVERYWQTAAETPSHTLFVEKQIRQSYERFTLMGRLDRLDERLDGSLEIIDYKSVCSRISPEIVHDSLAMICYTLLTQRLYPDQRVLATIVCLSEGTSATTGFTQDELDAFEGDVGEIAGHILGCEEFPPNYGPHCLQCIYNKICYKGGPVDWETKRKQFEQAQYGL